METADLGNVPDLLRAILEDTLSQDASPASLDRYLPRIRDIIINLLHGLKRKQQKLRQKQSKEEASSSATSSARQNSMTSSGSGDAGLTQILEDGSGRFYSNSSLHHQMARTGSKGSNMSDEPGLPPRSSSVLGDRASPVRHESITQMDSKARTSSMNRDASPNQRMAELSSSSTSGGALQQHSSMSAQSVEETSLGQFESSREAPTVKILPPPPPPKQQEALAALQRGGDLERRASRRYSTYQLSKTLGASPNGMPMLPPAQNSPIPNRGRDVRESMNAVRVRGSLLPGQQRSPNRSTAEKTSGRHVDAPQRIAEEGNHVDALPIVYAEEGELGHGTSKAQLIGEKAEQSPSKTRIEAPSTPSTVIDTSQKDDQQSVSISDGGDEHTAISRAQEDVTTTQPEQAESRQDHTSPPVDARQTPSERSPQPGKELTLFLQYKSKIKKFILADGESELSVARLQLAFIEKFSWNTYNNGNDLPDIYIQDPVSGVRHELEDLNDVRDRSVLVLNVEALDEVKRHIDERVAGLGKMVEEVRQVVDGQQATIQLVSDRQTDAAKDLARIAAGPVPSSKPISPAEAPLPNGIRGQTSSGSKASQLNDIQNLRRDLGVVRQTYSSFVSDIRASMSEIRSKASSVRSVASSAIVPVLDNETGRAYVNKGKKELGEFSDALVSKVDDLQDVVEDLRKDVVARGVRPLPRQLETVGKEVAVATAELKKIQEFLRREKPKWSKIWEKELQVVCDDRDLLTMQEALAADLQDDLEHAAQTFALVEEATKEQMKDGHASLSRSASRTLNPVSLVPSMDPQMVKEGVLGEVRALQPNHEDRLEAIQRAEKARQKELESRSGGEFQKELGSFVEEGRLKKSGGVEEADRQRKAKDERIRKEVWEKQNTNSKGKEVESIGTPQSDREGSESPVEGTAESSGMPQSNEGGDTDREHKEDGKASPSSKAA